ncbi:MAG: YkgJ family cysteine cluster protein [Candidatus Thorarchaeota archaeon]
MNLSYSCQRCGTCCHEVPGDYMKRIPLYPDEVDRLINEAKNRGVEFKVIEDLVFPDVNNKKIYVITYRILLDNENQCCPFYNQDKGCVVHDIKPLACKSYPLALKHIDAFNFQISIDPLCNFVIAEYDSLKNADLEKLKEIFKDEYPKAEKFYRKNKKLMFKIRQLEYEKKIKIITQISLEDFNKALKEYDRVEITVGKE